MRRDNNFVFFLVFLGITFFILILGQLGTVMGVVNLGTDSSLKISSTFSFSKNQNGELANLKKENSDLRKKVLNDDELIKENKALRDQFSTTSISSTNLIPASVVGSPGFIPGVSNPDYFIINKGKNDGVYVDSAVVYLNNFVGKIIAVSSNYSKVRIAINLDSFTAKVVDDHEISGVAKGEGNLIILDNILLSETLKKDQIVLTKGNMEENGLGIPPELVVGKIISIEKKSSDLFQKAEVQSFLNFKNLSTVFVIKK